MEKDTIYIDIEDDITSIIGKVKAAGSKIVALVPPKRAGVLQSVVNLKLLHRAAEAAGKRVVLITNDPSLITLAAGLKMPVAKNLQSRPEIPQMPAPEAQTEEVINGADIPVGELADLADKNPTPASTAADEISDKIELGSKAAQPAKTGSLPVAPAAPKPKPLGKIGVPNFDLFRKRLFLIGGGLVALVIFLVWALAIAPRATVTISAKTTAINIDRVLTLDPNFKQSTPDKFDLKPVVQQVKKAVAVEFDATGSKDIGNKAAGTITVRNCDYPEGFTVAAGTRFTAASGQVFLNGQSVSVPKFTGLASACTLSGATAGKADVAVQALELGPDYNIDAQAYTISGIAGEVDARGAATSGGTREKVTVVTQEDADKAKAQLTTLDKDQVKAELKKQFSAEHIVIDESYSVDQGASSASPAVGEQAKRGKVAIETTYMLTGLLRTDVRAVLQNAINDVLKDKANQQQYSLGENAIAFQSFEKSSKGYSSRLVTTGYVGPKIDSKQLAEKIKGKRYGEIEAIVNEISGVDKVDIKLSPFWVTTAPGPDKTEIKFSVVANGQ